MLATKLHIPAVRAAMVGRPRLIDRLNTGGDRKLTLISAPAGFGKTTLVSAWLAGRKESVAWVSLDARDADPTRFLSYFVAAVRTVVPSLDTQLLETLQSPQPPPTESNLIAVLNALDTIQERCIIVLDDYHVIESTPVDDILAFLLEHLPPPMHLVIVTRETPPIPLARLRARHEMIELRAGDLRFTREESADFLTSVMGLHLAAHEIDALESRTEGWIAGLQLAALSMQGKPDAAGFISALSDSHHVVLDYLLEEVLQRQPDHIQAFLLRTSILDRMCGPLCDALLLSEPPVGQSTLEYLERANLFIIPLDHQRRWYRYHHLFADLLRQRLQQRGAAPPTEEQPSIATLHLRASRWYESNAFEIDAFHHAASANDIDRAERLIEGTGIPLHFRGAVTAILDWLKSLPTTVLNARPSLWWRYAALLLVNGQTTGVEEKLQAAETAIARRGLDTKTDQTTRTLLGRIAVAKATLALTRYQVETMITESHRALAYLAPDDHSYIATAHWTAGIAAFYQGDRVAARQSITDAIALSHASATIFTTILASTALGQLQEADNQLYLAAETYRRVLALAGHQPLQIIYEAHLGLATVLYAWNDLDAAEHHGHQSLHLAQQYDRVIDRSVVCEIFLARVKLARGDVEGAAALLAQVNHVARQQNFIHRMADVAAAQVPVVLHQGNLALATHLAAFDPSPLSKARVLMAQGDAAAALALLEPVHQQADVNGWRDDVLKLLVLESVAHQIQGDKKLAVNRLREALTLAEPGGFIRLFVDEGVPMQHLLQDALALGVAPDYIRRLLSAFPAKGAKPNVRPPTVESLSDREVEVLQHIAEGRMDREIADRLYISLYTVKVHARNIYGKLDVNNRMQAVAKARQLGILPRS